MVWDDRGNGAILGFSEKERKTDELYETIRVAASRGAT